MLTKRPPAREIFVRRLNELLPRRGDAKPISERTNIAESTISNWRNGKGAINPTLDSLIKLASALGVSVGYLVSEGSDDDERRQRFERERDQVVADVEALRARAAALGKR